MANNNTYKRPVIVWGNSFYINISLEKFNAGAYEDFDLTKATDLKVYLICATHNTEIPLEYEIIQGMNNVLRCFVDYRLLHTTSYGVVVEGYDEQNMHFRFEMLPKEGFLVVNNTSGMSISDDVQVVDISARVGWGISYNGDLTNYYTKSEVDNLIAEIEIDLSDYYTKEEINQLVNQFPTKSEIDARFNDYYTKTQVNGLISDLEDIVDDKQDTLVSGVNIKTINNESILGEGNIDIQGGGGSVEPIILQYGQTISDETMSKIVEQKTNIWLKYGVNSLYSLAKIINYDNTSPALGFINNTNIYDNNNNTTGQIQISIISYVFHRWTIDTYILDDHTKIEKLFNEQFKTTADALWDLDNRINKNKYITNKKLESIENNTKDTLDEFEDNVNEQLSVAANTLIEHSERLAVQSDWNESDSSSLAYIQNKPTISTPVQSDWNESDSSSLAYIQNKPSVSEPGFIKVTNGNKTGLVSSLTTHYDTNIGNYSIIFGDAYSSGSYAIKASGNYSIAEGYGTKAIGAFSHAEGNMTQAKGISSHTFGEQTIANNDNEIASGKYNVSTKTNTTFGDAGNTLFSVGNGSNFNNKHNAFEIRQNGDIYLNDGTHPISSTTNGLKIEVVSALPSNPSSDTIYIVQ